MSEPAENEPSPETLPGGCSVNALGKAGKDDGAPNPSEDVGPDSDIRKLAEELENERKKTSDLSNRMKYLQADIANLQRQSDRMVVDVRNQAKSSLVLDLVSIKEDLDRAIDLSNNSGKESLIEGLRLLAAKIENILKAEDVSIVKAEVGQKLNPRLHEAVAFNDSGGPEEDSIVSVVAQGYTLNGKLLKPALVEVARKSRANETKEATEDNIVSPVRIEDP